MIANVLYTQLAIALAVLLFYSARGAYRGYGRGRLIPLTLLSSASLFVSLYLMVIANRPWYAVGVAAVVALPVFAPVMLMLLSMVISWLSGKPMRWN